ncbi:hypothetical protein, partial [Asanoa sp. NPDC050611]|uniref:hypothetical protein n=1 Tax=Asanoa sp. NPDC050611 TaxID=3157098 RepID=UPI00340A09AD
MTRSAPRSRARSGALSALLSVLVVALLVPTGVLFTQTWRTEGDRAAATQRELDGVAYLRTLQQVVFAVADAQSAAVTGQPAQRDALVVAVQQADATDARLGATLRTTERWTGIRSRLETLRGAAPSGNPLETMAAYREVGDLVLALYAKVRDESGLVHDPDGDAFHLQNSAAGELPVAVLAVGRLADVALIAEAARTAPAPGRTPLRLTPEQQTQLGALLVAERVTLFDASTRLVEDLRSAVDSTESRTLGSNLLSRLDSYQRTADIIAAGFAQPRPATSGDKSMISIYRGQLQAAAGELSSTILNEVERLLNTRADQIGQNRLLAGGAAALAVLLTVGCPSGRWTGRRTRPATGRAP